MMSFVGSALLGWWKSRLISEVNLRLFSLSLGWKKYQKSEEKREENNCVGELTSAFFKCWIVKNYHKPRKSTKSISSSISFNLGNEKVTFSSDDHQQRCNKNPRAWIYESWKSYTEKIKRHYEIESSRSSYEVLWSAHPHPSHQTIGNVMPQKKRTTTLTRWNGKYLTFNEMTMM